jgi:hypothetical protein
VIDHHTANIVPVTIAHDPSNAPASAEEKILKNARGGCRGAKRKLRQLLAKLHHDDMRQARSYSIRPI